MKLAIITGGFLPVPATKGGAVENLIVNFISKNEEKKDFEITIFSDFDSEALEESRKYEYSNFKFIKTNPLINIGDKIIFFIAKNILKKSNSHSYRFILKRLSYLNKVSKSLKKDNYDKVLLENHPTEYLALKWRKNYIKYKNKYYYHCHNEFPGLYGCKDIINDTKNFICVSEYISNTLSEYLSLPKDQFSVLRNGIEASRFTTKTKTSDLTVLKNKYNISKEEKIIIFTGRIVPEKGIRELLESLKNVKYDKYKVLIVGSALNDLKVKTNYELEVEKLVSEVQDKVIFTGFISYNNIPKLYHLADVAVLPSIWDDPAPLTVIESLVCGLPIITTNSGGIPEYAINGSAIVLKRDTNLIGNLSKNIDLLLSNSELLNKMKEKSLEASKDLTLENYYNNCVSILNKK